MEVRTSLHLLTYLLQESTAAYNEGLKHNSALPFNGLIIHAII